MATRGEAGFTLISAMIGMGMMVTIAQGMATIVASGATARVLQNKKNEASILRNNLMKLLSQTESCRETFKGLKFDPTAATLSEQRIENIEVKLPTGEIYLGQGVQPNPDAPVKSVFLDNFRALGSERFIADFNIETEGLSKKQKFEVVLRTDTSIGNAEIFGCNQDEPDPVFVEMTDTEGNSGWKCNNVMLESHCGDVDGCRMRITMEWLSASGDPVKVWEDTLFFEQVGNSSGKYVQIGDGIGGHNYILGTTSQVEVLDISGIVFAYNFKPGMCDENNQNGAAYDYPYKLTFASAPGIRTRVFLYD